jgi:hypothetical protein
MLHHSTRHGIFSAALLAGTACAAGGAGAQQTGESYDLLIAGGSVLYGTGPRGRWMWRSGATGSWRWRRRCPARGRRA